MGLPILVITPQASLGALIRRELDSDLYNVTFTADFSEAIKQVRQTGCPLVLLDCDLDDMGLSLFDLGYALRQIQTDLEFIVLKHPEQNLGIEEQLHPAAILTKPISMTTLKKYVEELAPATFHGASMSVPNISLSETDAPIHSLAETSRLVWVKDVSKAAQHLTRLTLESSAQAALITRESELWAYAGQLSREAAQELSGSIQRYWDGDSESDILRFLRLELTGAQHILYARKLTSSMILALVFDGETSFSTIRSQAGKLVKNLSSSAETESMPPFISPVDISSEAGFSEVDEPEEEDLPPFAELLGDVPPPIPPARHTPAQRSILPWEHQPVETAVPAHAPVSAPRPAAVSQPPVNSLAISSEVATESPKRPIPAMDETMAVRLPVIPAMDVTMAVNVPAAPPQTQRQANQPTRPIEPPDDGQMTRKHETKDQALLETRPQTSAEPGSTGETFRILLEPASPAMADLAYACLLVPRFDTHHLVGDAAERLSEWVPQVCVAFGWRLEHFAVRPNYLQWVVRVPPTTAPGSIMRIIRQQTSERLLNEFPRLKKDNPAGDFWAPGYLLMGRSQPHPQELVRSFIKQTRERQGLTSGE